MVLAIPESSTIAYRQSVAAILQGLAKGGLPPFGSILLALIATNEQLPQNTLGEIGELMEETITEAHLLDSSPVIQHLQALGEATQFLQILQKLPAKYKTLEGRILLFRCIFEKVHQKEAINKSEIMAERFADADTYELPDTYILKPYSSATFLRDFQTLGRLLRYFPNIESIIEQVGDVPELNELDKILDEEKEIPTEAIELDFIEELIEDDRTFPIGALIRSFWAGLKIPVNNAIPSDQKYGGVADLTTKGEFDKLLLSEFANEDIVLLSRLANNEALYFNKETPPIENAFQRIILVDVSLKNWGTPKTLIHAIGLAIAKHPKSGEDCKIFALGKSFTPIEYDSVDKVIHALQEVDIALHPAVGLAAFLGSFSSDKSLELFFISSVETLKLPAMQRIMQEQRTKIRYWIQVDAQGRIDFYKNLNGGKKHLQHLQLDLETLWKPQPKRRKQPPTDMEELSIPSFSPILYPLPSNLKQVLIIIKREEYNDQKSESNPSVHGVEDIYFITNNKKLYRLENPSNPKQKGAQVIMEKIPPFKEVAIGKMSNNSEYILFFNAQDRKISLINLWTLEVKETYFNDWQNSTYNKFIFYEDVFYYLSGYQRKNWMIDPDTLKIEAFEEDTNLLIEIYKIQQSILYTTNLRISVASSILKNINTLFINQYGNLVLNDKHELKMNSYGIFKLELGTKHEKIIMANKTDYGFIFEEGSKVFIDRAGIMILESSNTNFSKVYIPLVLDSSLGLATEDNFAGNEYYLPNSNNLKKIHANTMNTVYLKPFTNTISNKH